MATGNGLLRLAAQLRGRWLRASRVQGANGHLASIPASSVMLAFQYYCDHGAFDPAVSRVQTQPLTSLAAFNSFLSQAKRPGQPFSAGSCPHS